MGWASRVWKAALEAAPMRLWALFAAGPVLTLGTGVLVWIVKADTWPVELRERQLEFLGWAMLASLAIVAVIVITLAAVRVKGRAGIAEFEVGGDGSPQPSQPEKPE